jgi:hypothetical protein
VSNEFDPSPAQAELMREAARQLDELDAIRAAIKADGPTVTGSRKQTRAHPLYAELARGRTGLTRLLDALNFEDEYDDEADLPAPVDIRRVMTAQQIRASKAGRSSARRASGRRVEA